MNKHTFAQKLIAGGDRKNAPVTLENITVDGEKAVVYIRTLSAGDVMAFVDAQKSKDEGARTQSMFEVIAKGIVDEDGIFIFDDAKSVSGIPMDVFTQLSEAVTKTFNTSDPTEKDSENTDSSDSPTD